MHILHLTSEFAFSPDDKIKPGVYLGEDLMLAQLLVMSGGGQMEPLRETRKPLFSAPDADKDLLVAHSYQADQTPTLSPCHSILIGRTGGLGDLTLLTPVLREIKRRWPTVKIAVACIKELGQSIHNLPFIDEVLQYPVAREVADTYDGWIWLENAIEKNEDAKTLHSVDCVAKFIGLELPADMDKRQAYVVTDKERAWAQWAHPRINGVRRLCVQVGASARCRTYPQQKLGVVIAEMLKKGWEVFLLGQPGEIKVPEQHRPGLRIVADGATFRQRCALIESADCVLAPDSSLTHIAGALEIPAIALFGPFHWNVRTKYCPTTKALMRTEGFSCAPCFHHATPRAQFPDNCPTKAKGICGVLDAIEPQKIVSEIEAWTAKWSKRTDCENIVAFEPEASNGKA